MKKRTLLVLMAVAMLLVQPFTPASAAQYPTKPITIVVPFAAGGETDLVARMLATALSKELKQNVLVQNVVGASGVTGISNMLASRPDGYTLGVTPSAPLVMHPHMRSTPYTADSFTYIGRIMKAPYLVVVNKSSPWNSLSDMLKDMEANPDKYFWGSSGVGSVPYFALMDLFASFGVKARHVPFTGDANAFQDLAGNRIQVYVTTAGMLQNFDIKALAVLDKQREPLLPDLPSVQELGKEVYFSQWMPFLGPKDLPANVVATLNTAMEKACASPEFLENMRKLNLAASYLNAADTKAFVTQESARNKIVIERLMKKE